MPQSTRHGALGGAAGFEASLTPEEIESLAAASAYPDDPSATVGVQRVQTHLSQVFLTGARVYKFRKAVDLSFVRFVARAERNADCLREVALNRRLAPDVYLGVAPLRQAPLRIGPVAETLAPPDASGSVPEHCVVMRRLPADRDALSLLARDALSDAQLESAALLIARFHERHRLGTPAPFTPAQWRQRCVGPVEDNLRLLAKSPPTLLSGDVLRELATRTRGLAETHADRFERRRLAGRAVDGHGDLHLQHLWYERDDAEPIAIDCLEFSAALRQIDVAAEVAFPAMDLRYREATSRAELFLRSYARESDDFDLYAVVDFFTSYRASVRAKVASIAALDPTIDAAQRARAAASAGRHLDLALEMLAPRGAGALVLVGGIVGTGKSTAAREFAAAVDAVVIASDRVRKHQAGLAPTARPGAAPDSDLYAPERREKVYAGLLERAAPVLASGRTVVLDATWELGAERERARAFAIANGVRACFLETRCEARIARERLARRAASGTDASDAGPELYERSAARFEPAREWPAEDSRVLRTDQADWPLALRALAKEWPAARARGART